MFKFTLLKRYRFAHVWNAENSFSPPFCNCKPHIANCELPIANCELPSLRNFTSSVPLR
jgi:hypothetical protein